ncbi:hypothetical protein DIPPA_18954 [Diplonema papillatum]|nr:hypothetical protein DIPPA_18954 [Diplonema papillatum]
MRRWALAGQARWAGGGGAGRREKETAGGTRRETGREMAARLKRERDARIKVEFPGHATEHDVRRYNLDKTPEERVRLRKMGGLRQYADAKGGVDLWDYFYGRFGGLSDESVVWESHQPGSLKSKWARLAARRRKQRFRGKSTRWSDGHRTVGGFRATGGPKTEAKSTDKGKEEEVEYEEIVKVTVPNPYRILSLPPHASKKHAADNYRKLAKQFHPDAPNGSVEKMAEINDAYALVRQILKEGGPTKSRTAREGTVHTTEHAVRSKRKKSAGGAENFRKEEEELEFELNSFAAAERAEMRRMAYEFHSSATASERRREAREERRMLKLDGLRPPTLAQELNNTFRFLVVFSLAGIAIISILTPDARRVTVRDSDDPCEPAHRI